MSSNIKDSLGVSDTVGISIKRGKAEPEPSGFAENQSYSEVTYKIVRLPHRNIVLPNTDKGSETE